MHLGHRQAQLWYKHAICYEVYVRAFRDANGDGHGDLRGLQEKLDYLQWLGVDCLWLLPIYPSPLKDDGYDVADYYDIHPDYGTLDDFRNLLAAAHKRGIRILLDLVLNHTSDQHPWFQEARRNPDSPYRDYYVWSDTGREYPLARIIFLDFESSNWTWDPVAQKYYWHRFYRWQPDLNYDNPAVQEEMLRVVRYWLAMGVDGFRVDAAPYLFEREGTNCENLPETHAFLKRLRRFVDEHFPGRVLISEANQWPQDVRAYFGGDPNDPSVPSDEFHMAFHFPLMPRLFMALKQGRRDALEWVMSVTPPIPYDAQWATFLRNHDELTLEMVTEEERQWMWEQYAPDPRMRLNLGIRRRLAPLLDGDRRKILLAHALLLAFPGTPFLYYGDEIGMGDNLDLPDRDGVRTPMQWTNEPPNAGFTAPEVRPYTLVIADPPYGFPWVNVAAQQTDPNSLLNALRRMIAIRKAHPAFGAGEFAWERAGSAAVVAFWRTTPQERLLLVHNLSPEPQVVRLPAGRYADLFTGRLTHGAGQELPPYGYLWLQAV